MNANPVLPAAPARRIGRLVEPTRDRVVVTDAHPMDHNDPNARMFGLSPEDQAIEDERRRTQPGKGER